VYTSYGDNDKLLYYGISHKFKCTVDTTAISPTTMNIKWKWINYGPNVAGHPVYDEWDYEYLEYYKLHYYLKIAMTNNYVHYNQDDEDDPFWELKSGTQETGGNYLKVLPADVDQTNGLYEVSIDIPMKDVSGMTDGDTSFILDIGWPEFDISNDGGGDAIVTDNIVGDFQVTMSYTQQDNEFTATLPNSFRNKKEIELDIFDEKDLNSRNGIFTAYDLGTRTSDWTTDGITTDTLTRKLLSNKSQLYNQTRYTIGATILETSRLKPFSNWYDTSTGLYLLTSYTRYPLDNTYDVQWTGYDNTIAVNLVDE